MYRAFVDGTPLFDPANGYSVSSPEVSIELNKVGSFEFTIYPDHPSYSLLRRMKSIVTVYDRSQMIFRGRILNDTAGFRNEKLVECESDLAFLLDSVQRPYDYQGTLSGLFTQYINNHNSQVEESKKFIIGKISVTDSNDYVHYSSTEYPTTWDEIQDKLIDTHGGYVFIRHESTGNYIDYVDDFNLLSNQPITFGSNLIDYSRKVRGEDLATALIPLGAKLTEEDAEGNETESDDRLTIASVNDGKDYIYDEDAVASYGWIFATETWDDVTIAGNLLTKARQRLGELVLLGNELELSAVDLAALDSSYSAFHLGTYVKVDSKPHDLSANFLVSKQSINLADPTSNTLSLGATYESLTDQIQPDLPSIGDIVQEVTGSMKPTATGFTLQYYLSDSPTELTGGEWVDGSVEWQDGKYIWSRPATTYSNGVTQYGDPVCITGNDGADGDTGTKVAGIETEYNLSESADTPPAQDDEGWTTDYPAWEKPEDEDAPETYCWARTKITYEDGSVVYTTPMRDATWNAITELDHVFSSQITQTEGSILQQVSENYFDKNSGDLLASKVTTLEQTSDGWEFTWNEFKVDLEDWQNGVDSEFLDIARYIRFIDGTIELGEIGNPIMLRIENDIIGFYENNVLVAYFNNQRLYVTEVEVLNRLIIGNFAFYPRDNGNMTLRYIGGEMA